MDTHSTPLPTAPAAALDRAIPLTAPELSHDEETQHLLVVDEDGHFYGIGDMRVVIVGSSELDAIIDTQLDAPWSSGTPLVDLLRGTIPDMTDYDLHAEYGLA